MRMLLSLALLLSALPALACDQTTARFVAQPTCRIQEIPSVFIAPRTLPPMPLQPQGNFLQVSSTPAWEGSATPAVVRPARFADSPSDKLDRILQRLEKLDELERRIAVLERK